MMRMIMATAALGLLCACAKKEAAPAPAEPAATAIAAPVDAAAEPIEGDAASAWIEMTGLWAPEGGCGDATVEWRIEAEAFHQYEAHCAIVRLELLRNGVRAVAQCAIEGDDDGAEDAFKFVRRPDATLSVLHEMNGAVTDGLRMCGDGAP